MEPEVLARFERIEKTLDRVADSQAKAEARADRMDAKFERRFEAFEKRFEASEKRFDTFDKRLEATRKLVDAGMRLLVKNEAAIRDLTRSQKLTDRKLQAFIDSLNKGHNGRH